MPNQTMVYSCSGAEQSVFAKSPLQDLTQLSNILVFVFSDLFFSSQLCFLPPNDLSQTANSRGTIAMDEVDDETEMQGDDIEIGLSIK